MKRYYEEKCITVMVILIFLMVSCIKPPVASEAKRTLPKQFEGNTNTDTVSIANISFRNFFSDTVLVELIEKAIANNPDFKIAVQKIEINRAQLMTARAALLPSVQAAVTFSADRFGKFTMNGVGNFDTNLSPDISKEQRIPERPYTEMFLGLRSIWEIDVWKKLSNRRKAAAARFNAVVQERNLLQTMIVSETAMLYYTLLALDYELEVLKRNVLLQQTELDLIKVQKDAGKATELAVKQFAAQLMRTKSLEYEIKQQIIVAENQLNYISGSFPGKIARGKYQDQIRSNKHLGAGLPSFLLERRPDIIIAALQLEAAGADVNVARAAFMPQFTLSPYIGMSAFNPSLLFRPESFAAGSLSGLIAPVFQQKQIRAAYQISIAQNKQAYYEYEKVVLRSVQEVVTDLMALENLQQSYKLKMQEVVELKEGLKVAGDLYNAGFATYLEIITAQRNVLDAELEQIVLMNNIMLAEVDLYRSLGGG